MFSKNKTRFDWRATESAPKNFPMRIIEGAFYYRDGSGGLYVPTAASIGFHWGAGESIHVVGDDYKPLPDRLDIRFYSFFEDQLYQGSFDLPYEKILALFKEGVQRDKDSPIFHWIVVGVAPGGAVSVWVSGGESREVFFGQAQPYDDEMRTPLGNLIDDRKEYAQSYLEDLPEEHYTHILETGIPFGRWEKYRTRYNWRASMAGTGDTDYFRFSFFNGEHYWMYLSDDAQDRYGNSHAMPLTLGFTTLFPGGNMRYVYGFRFDEDELFAAFARLGANGALVTMEVDPQLPKENTRITLSNGEETIELKKLTLI